MGKKNESTSKGRTVHNQPADSHSVPGIAGPAGSHRKPGPSIADGLVLVDYDSKAGIVYLAVNLNRADKDLQILTSLINSLKRIK